MPALEIMGVDFSGARSDRNTWLAQGTLNDEGLVLHGCRPVARAELTELLASMTHPAVASLDFPFSVPLAFTRYWLPDGKSMPDLWTAAEAMEPDQFIALRDAFVARWGEPKRLCDTHYPECYSCLHMVNPNMVPMTFYGMRMLGRLWEAGCAVPPLDQAKPGQVVLLEAMPGAALRALGLPYKGYKNGVRAVELRKQILDGLPQRVPLSVSNLEEVRELCMANHDCLDSVVGAVTAALWTEGPTAFRLPPPEWDSGLDPAIRVEGWLYVPVFLSRDAA